VADLVRGDLGTALTEFATGWLRDAGMLVAFDSGLVHEVRPITWGTRCTVAAWYVGAP